MKDGCDVRFDGCGIILKQIRKTAGMGIREFALIAECDRGRISKIENDQISLSLSMIEKFAPRVGIPTSDVLLQCLKLVTGS